MHITTKFQYDYMRHL